MRSLAIMRKFAPVVFDATHSVQLPSASHEDEDNAAISGGQPEFIPVLSRSAVAAGVDGIFMEVHDNPKEAKSRRRERPRQPKSARSIEGTAGREAGSRDGTQYAVIQTRPTLPFSRSPKTS